MPMRCKIAIFVVLIVEACVLSYAEEAEQKAQGLDMVSDTVATAFNKATALLSGKLEITMSLDKPNTEEQFTTNAIGQKVPKSTAIRSAGSLHNDDPL
ncbi:MAG: hypothetical protein KKH77_00970 [Candidatus Omnitrophica bacterium]|nr:hypothetical protein [Candidatus Omnitrophota bacterium]